tara:strand:+ start:1131 stop:1658 length:528 start_codon:yes stop_codon:yes gene_type:complete
MYEPLWIRLRADMTQERIHACMKEIAPTVIRKNQGCVITVDGYDNDERELYDIPEVVDLFKRLMAEGFISLLEVSTSIEEMAPEGMPVPFPGLGALEVWAMSEQKYNEWFGGGWVEHGERRQGQVATVEIKRFLDEVLMESNAKAQAITAELRGRPTKTESAWNKILKDPPYRTT